MQQHVNYGRPSSDLANEFKRKASRALPLVLIPCVPAVVACGTFPFAVHAGIDDGLSSQWVVANGAPPPLLLRPLSESAAIALNRRIPFSRDRGPPAEPFTVSDKGNGRARALECLTSAIYYEAASESVEGQAAVAQVILNRLRHPAFPASVCEVIYQGSMRSTGCQFSYTCDGSLQRIPTRREWDQAEAIANAALSGAVYAPVGLATHYHTEQVVPYWAPSLAKSAQVGAHIFYRWARGAGRPEGFTQRYSGKEEDPLTLRRAALIAHNIWPSDAEIGGKPRLSVAIDPDTELSGIVRILASVLDASAASPYEKAVRAHFSGNSAKPLVESLAEPATVKIGEPAGPARPLGPRPATLDEKLLSAADIKKSVTLDQLARDSGAEVGLKSFLRAHKRLYLSTARRAQQMAEQAAVDWEIYTGAPVKSRSVVISLAHGLGRCPVPKLSKKAAFVIPWPVDPGAWGPPDIFLASGFAEDSLAPVDGTAKRKTRQLRAAIEPIKAQIVAAVFARVTAVSQGEATARKMIAREVAQGNELVPLLTRRLAFYERHRDEFPTLSHFLPRLMANLPAAAVKNITEPKAAVSDEPSCGPALVKGD